MASRASQRSAPARDAIWTLIYVLEMQVLQVLFVGRMACESLRFRVRVSMPRGESKLVTEAFQRQVRARSVALSIYRKNVVGASACLCVLCADYG